MPHSRTFSPVPASVPEVRRFVMGCVGGLGPPTRDVVNLLVSEVATNAVLHARTEFEVSVDLSKESILVHVADRAHGLPSLGPRPAPTEPHGRGLMIVSELADEWGVWPTSDGSGKSVWFRLDL